ncbi:MAG: Histone deacetylase domain [Rhodobacteraceae bacterium HLUCCO07]|nr:MAG: Histone deacetylase domain [Rhodobacteraceae bacterium HLUCCO07]
MLAFISHADCMGHDTGALHPDQPGRISAIENQLIMSGLDFVLRRLDAPKVTRAQLERVHDANYLDRIYALDPVTEPVEIDGDTVMSPGTLRAAERAAGAGILGVDLIMAGEVHAAFCAVAPAGAPCRAAPRHGVLPFRQYRGGCRACA